MMMPEFTPHPTLCNASTFSLDLGNTYCPRLDFSNATSPTTCAQACCSKGLGCEMWQYCPAGSTCAEGFWFEADAVLLVGHDRPNTPLHNVTIEAAQMACHDDTLCIGLTFKGRDAPPPGVALASVYLNSAGVGRAESSEWSVYMKATSGCYLGQRSVRCANASASGWTSRARPPPQYKAHFVSSVFGDHMVLQRAPQAAMLWGVTAPGGRVLTSFNGANLSSTADAHGTWRQQLPPTPASMTPHTLTIVGSGADELVTLTDILFGDVYLCGGRT